MAKKLRYARLEKNDFINGEGICVSFWTQGCPHRCPGCHNPETWDFNGGIEENLETIFNKIDKAMTANNIKRNFSILGGEPLCVQNIELTTLIVLYVKSHYPESKIYLWTGYDFQKEFTHSTLKEYVDVIIDGPYIESLRDTTLKLRGSTNQRILYKGIDF